MCSRGENRLEMMAHRRPPRRRSAGPNENHRLELPWYALPHGSSRALGSTRANQGRLIFLSESHLNKYKAGELCRVFDFDSMFVVESDGRTGGLIMFYHKMNKVVLNYVSANLIDVLFLNDNVVQWRFTGFYGHPNWRDRNLSWEDIHNLHNKGGHPWVVLGDFNEILLSSEKEGGNARPNAMMREFRNC
uniref:Endonuclease/exonuclease/phosphatase domain-containing protein n=1 Tax=Aegilops tauschii subsp. strangulata TaxID=200361 RepID=A0A453BHN4_AEGTS